MDHHERRDQTHHLGDYLFVAALAGVLVVCVAALTWPIPWVGAGGGASTPPPLDLRTAPWLTQTDGAPTIDRAPALPSLVFPAGVDYPEALRQLYLAARKDGTLPHGTILADPLPAEVVLVEGAAGQERVRVSLLAPFGWTPQARKARAPSVRVPADLPHDQARKLMADLAAGNTPQLSGVEVDAPRLIPCQVAIGTPHNRPSCQ